MEAIIKRIDKRLANEGKPAKRLAARKGGDINKIKAPIKKVKNFKGKPARGKRVANNATKPFRIQAAEADQMKFRQESDQAVGPKPFKKDNQPGPHKDLDMNKFVRVSNNVFRNEESILDQAERMIFSRNIKRGISQELNRLEINQHHKVADIMEAGHVAEKKAQADADKQFLSKFTGETRTLVEVPEIKQQVDENMNIVKRGRPSIEGDKTNKNIQKFIDDFNLRKAFLPDPREQARMAREKLS